MDKEIEKKLEEMEKRIMNKLNAIYSFLVALQTGDLRKEDF